MLGETGSGKNVFGDSIPISGKYTLAIQYFLTKVCICITAGDHKKYSTREVL